MGNFPHHVNSQLIHRMGVYCVAQTRPLLLMSTTEATWNTRQHREQKLKLAEINMFILS